MLDAEVPGLRLLVDTGHVADWGGDPCELLELADHVQLRQGKPGHTQVHVDDPSGVVDFAAVLRRLDGARLPRARLSVEYFDLPDNGWPLDDPEPGPATSPRTSRPDLLGLRSGGAGPGGAAGGRGGSAFEARRRRPGSRRSTNSVRQVGRRRSSSSW